jgi:hypothetical protein
MEKHYKDIMRALIRKLRTTLVGGPSPTGFVPGSLDRELERIGIASDGTIIPVDGLLNNIRNGELRAYHVAAEILSPLPLSQRPDARHEIIERAAYTWINRLLALRMMEVRRLIYSTLRGKKDYEGLSEKLYFLRQEEPQRIGDADGGWWAVIEDACKEQAKALPGLFALNDPVAALRPAPAALIQCIEIITGSQPLETNITPDDLDITFADPDAIGWAYQFYQEETKARIDAKCKAGGKVVSRSELAAKTELFTEPYMVQWLLQNGLGRSYHEAYPYSSLPDTWEYYVKPETLETATRFDLDDLTLLDPCMGSGHFLRVAFDMFVAMYREQKPSFTAREIADNILSTHLYGIDLDPRAAQLAALTLYLRAWELVRDEQHKARKFGPCVYIPPKQTMNLATTPVGLTKGALERHLQRTPQDKIFETLLENIFTGLEQADILGSLLRTREYLDGAIADLLKPRNYELEFDPDTVMRHQAIIDMRKVNPAGLRNELLETIANSFKVEAGNTDDVSVSLFGYEAERGVRLLQMLDRQYTVVVTNPPYLGSKYMESSLKGYIRAYYPSGKRDLSATFILRCIELCQHNGRIAMITQQSWMFLRSFADLRAIPEKNLPAYSKENKFTGLLREIGIDVLAHLGEFSFEDMAAAGAFTAMFVFVNRRPNNLCLTTTFRLVGLKSAIEKAEALRNHTASIITQISQIDMIDIPESPLVYYLGEELLRYITDGRRLQSLADIKQGLATADDGRFLRYTWEVLTTSKRWATFTKGGGYCRWFGQNWYHVDWDLTGSRMKSFGKSVKRNVSFYFHSGWSYSLICRGSVSLRKFDVPGCIGHKGPGIYAEDRSLPAIVQSHVFSFILRAISPQLAFEVNTMARAPLPKSWPNLLASLAYIAEYLKRFLVSYVMIERTFTTYSHSIVEEQRLACLLHTVEGMSELTVCHAYNLSDASIQAMVDETGIPAGWNPLIVGYDTLPTLPDELHLPVLPQELLEYLVSHERISPDRKELDHIKARLKALYRAGPKAKEVELEGSEDTLDNSQSEEERVAEARIPIPTETFLEELSIKIGLHPISVYWLLEELRAEGIRCKFVEKQFLEDRLNVMILHLLGHRWPEQIEAEEVLSSWADEHGIIPLVPGTGKSILAERVRERLRIEDGALATQQTEALLQELTEQNLEQWLRRSFFPNHIQQFKHRPIAWHLASKPVKGTKPTKNKKNKQNLATPSSTPAFECLLYYHATPKGALTRIRVQYIEPLLNAERNKVEQQGSTSDTTTIQDETAIERDDTEATIAKLRIQELEDFAERLQRIEEEGFASPELQELLVGEPLDIWDGDGYKKPSSHDEFRRNEEAWRVDINDGVRVNIAPLQLAGVLATEVLKPADAKKAIADRARWRADERRWVRDGKLPRCGWMDERVPASGGWLENEATQNTEQNTAKPQQLDWTQQEGLEV